MTDKECTSKEDIENPHLQSASRRKAVKTLVGGITAFAAYNVLPSKWGTPIIEQVFLPAHAATSGTCSAITSCNLVTTAVELVPGSGNTLWNWSVRLTGTIVPAVAGIRIKVLRRTIWQSQTMEFSDFSSIVPPTLADGTFIFDDSTEGTTAIRIEYIVSIDGCPGSLTRQLDAPPAPTA